MKSPDEFNPDELNAKWEDLTRNLGPLDEFPAGSGPRDYEVPEDTSGFEPPHPAWTPPRPRAVLGAALLVLGLVGVVIVAVTRGPVAAGVITTLVALAGFVVLIAGLPRRSAPDDDDGARV